MNFDFIIIKMKNYTKLSRLNKLNRFTEKTAKIFAHLYFALDNANARLKEIELIKQMQKYEQHDKT